MPWAEDIEEYPAGGQKLTLIDNTKKIDALLAEWNGKQGWPPTAGAGGSSGTGSGGASAGGTSSGGTRSGGKSGAGGGSNAGDVRPAGGGCGVSSRSPLTGALMVSGLALLALARRRRRG